MTDQLRHNANLVDSLGSALRSGEHGLSTVPALLRRVLEEDSWREFVTKRGEHVEHERWEGFVTTPPLAGLGASMDLVDRIVGHDDTELLLLLRKAKAGKPGRPKKENGSESEPIGQTETTDYTVDRLARDAPDEYVAVQSGEKTIHRAALDAGIRKPRGSVRFDNPESAARTLRKHMSTDDLSTLAQLLMESEE